MSASLVGSEMCIRDSAVPCVDYPTCARAQVDREAAAPSLAGVRGRIVRRRPQQRHRRPPSRARQAAVAPLGSRRLRALRARSAAPW
eukprot:14172336-Alexandrium_andersonii.AAC.1